MIALKVNSVYGSTSHFYHFFYGALVPLILYHLQTKETVFTLYGLFGPMKRVLYELPFNITVIESKAPKGTKILIPMDTFISKFKKKNLFRLQIKHQEAIKEFFDNNTPDYIHQIPVPKVVIIKRKSEPLFKTVDYSIYKNTMIQDLGQKSGDERRSTLNFDEIVNTVKMLTKNVGVVALERTSIYYQVRLFSKAKIIIANHGAAMANIIFMKSNSHLIEIISKEKKYKQKEDSFYQICKRFNVNYYEILVNKEIDHVEPQKIKDILLKIKHSIEINSTPKNKY